MGRPQGVEPETDGHVLETRALGWNKGERRQGSQ